MDKKNVQNPIVKTLLTEKKFCLDVEKLWCQIKPKIKKICSQFFIFFCEKNT